MKRAAKKIQDGIYDINIPVISNDEVGKLCEGINSMAGGLKEKEFIKDTFGRIVDPRVRDFLLQGNVQLGGEMKELTILFSDIRSFTSASEKMKPDEVVVWLNRYFDKMSRCITDEKGLVNKYIGDAIMAIFGAPINQEDHADAAVRAAYRMIDELAELNREFSNDHLPPISIGIGIHTGQVLAGNIGSSDRMEYTVIGDAVNVASRLESLTKEYKQPVLMSESTSKALKHQYSMNCLNKVSIRGKEEPMDLYYCVLE
jgi:adenylate cyclase